MLTSRPKGGKRWALNRALTALIFIMGGAGTVIFFMKGDNDNAYKTIAITIGTLGLLGSGNTYGETVRPHDYGGDIVINQGSPNSDFSKISEDSGDSRMRYD